MTEPPKGNLRPTMTGACRVVIAALVAMLATGCATVPPRCKSEPSTAEGRVALDNPDPKYRDYFNKVRERIKAKWVYPRPAGERGIEGELLIEFNIAKDGRLAYIALRDSSGAAILDDAAMTAVKLAQPFPPVPDSASAGQLRVNGTFCYQIVNGLARHTLP